MVTTREDLDRKLAQLSGLLKDCTHGSNRWNIILERIDDLLDERGRLTVEYINDLKVDFHDEIDA